MMSLVQYFLYCLVVLQTAQQHFLEAAAMHVSSSVDWL
jgi:hypothetical protein